MKLSRLVTVSMVAAGFMMAHQVAGKAARDSIFLDNFPVETLPRMVMAAAATALILTFMTSRLLTAYGPRLVIPAGFAVSGMLHAAEWVMLGREAGLTAIVTYLHIVGFGAVLLSGFWSIANEAFDPANAKLYFGRIAGAGTAGGIVGGLLAERTAAVMAPGSVLLLLSGLHVLCAMTLGASSARVRVHAAGREEDAAVTPAQVFRKAPHLRDLALLVLLGTVSAAFIDYLFKAGATVAIGRGPSLLRFFAVFYTSVQVVTIIVQAGLTRTALVRLGLSRTVGSLPVVNTVMAASGLVFPAFPVFALARGSEYTLRGSLFRSGYELLYTPVAPQEKRAAKTVIDVAVDRAGDAIGAGIIQALLAMTAAFLTTGLLGLTLVASVAAILVARRLDRAYTSALEQRLMDHALELDPENVEDSTTMSAVLRTRTLMQAAGKRAASPAISETRGEWDKTIENLKALRSAHPATVLASLRRQGAFDAVEYPQIISLLAWDPAAATAREVLERAGAGRAGLLADHLLDPAESFVVRRRIPRILARCGTRRAFEALIDGLGDKRFEVRYQCARALDYMHAQNAEMSPPRMLIFDTLARELKQNPDLLAARRLLDEDDGAEPVDRALGSAADVNAEFITSLLSTILPREPLQVAFRAFHSGDRLLRGLAIEYFDSVLMGESKEAFRAYVKSAPEGSGRAPQAIMEELLASRVDEGRARESGGDARF